MTKAKKAPTGPSRSGLLFGGVVLLFVALGITFVLTDAPVDDADVAQVAPVEVDGNALPPLLDDGSDPALGATAPSVTGQDFAGDPVTLHAEGRGTVVAFLSHSCSHCQAEVPRIVDHLAPDDLPDGVDLLAVATATDATQANYPPSAWLEREGWPFPVIVDSSVGEAARAYGVDAFPFFVVLGPDGTLRFRVAGEISMDALDQLLELAAAPA